MKRNREKEQKENISMSSNQPKVGFMKKSKSLSKIISFFSHSRTQTDAPQIAQITQNQSNDSLTPQVKQKQKRTLVIAIK